MRAEARRPHPRGAKRAARWRRGGRVFGMACLLAALFMLAVGVGMPPGGGRAATASAHAASWPGSPAMTSIVSIVSIVSIASPSDAATSTASPTDSPTASPTVTPTDTPTPIPTATPTPIPAPTLAIISPSSGRGPVGARITVRGVNWSGGSVAIGAAADLTQCASTSAWSASFGAAQVHGNAITQTFTWPTALATPGTSYTICALGSAGTASASYEVLAATPPTLSLSVASTQVGQNLTIRGANFFGEPTVALTLSAPSGQRVLATIPPYGDGTFSYSYAPASTDTGTVTITASSTAEGGAPPTLQASAVLVVVAAGTPVPTITATVAITTTAGGGLPAGAITPPGSAGPPLWLLLSGVLVMLFVLLGLLAVFIIRQPPPASNAYPAVPGTGTPAALPGVGQHGTGRFATGGRLGTTGRVPVAEGPGAVAGWDDEPGDSGPGPDWRPRPMGGTHARIPAVESGDDVDAYTAAGGWEGTTGWVAPYADGYAYDPYDPPTRPGTGGPAPSVTKPSEEDASGDGEDLGATRGGVTSGGDLTRPLHTERLPSADAPAGVAPADDTTLSNMTANDPAKTNPDNHDEAE